MKLDLSESVQSLHFCLSEERTYFPYESALILMNDEGRERKIIRTLEERDEILLCITELFHDTMRVRERTYHEIVRDFFSL